MKVDARIHMAANVQELSRVTQVFAERSLAASLLDLGSSVLGV